MEGCVLSFLKAEWKVSDKGSAHWASSYFEHSIKSLFMQILLHFKREFHETLKKIMLADNNMENPIFFWEVDRFSFEGIIGLFENAMKKAEAVFVSETPRF